jgi:hypothetical protein
MLACIPLSKKVHQSTNKGIEIASRTQNLISSRDLGREAFANELTQSFPNRSRQFSSTADKTSTSSTEEEYKPCSLNCFKEVNNVLISSSSIGFQA